ncbi:DUF4166 domain-containing protein [Jatrophihabitans sp. DSM 45814]
MTSIFQRALGKDFALLHPKLQRRLSMSSASGTAQIGGGVMTHLTRGALAARPIALAGRHRRLELPASGADVAYDLANYAYLDTLGRETFAYSRRFHPAGRENRFDDTMIFSENRGCIVNYLGSHQDIAAELQLSVTPDGGIRMRGGDQRLYQGRFGMKLPRALAATAEVVESFDVADDRFTISVEIKAARAMLFGYRGWFRVADVETKPAQIPLEVRPDVERRQD